MMAWNKKRIVLIFTVLILLIVTTVIAIQLIINTENNFDLNEDKNNPKYSWNLTDIYKDENEYNKDKEELIRLIEELKTYKGILCDSSDNLYNFYSLYEKAYEINDTLYSYGYLKYDLDMSSKEGKSIYHEVDDLDTKLISAVSFVEPEILYADRSKIEGFLQNDSRLSRYSRVISEILDEKEHTLSEKEEMVLANLSDVIHAPSEIYDVFQNLDLKFGTLKNDRGKKVELNENRFVSFLKSKKQSVRKNAFNQLYDEYGRFNNTLSEMYNTNIKTTSKLAKLRNYNSAIERAVLNDDASIKVYNNLIEVTNNNLSANHEFMRLKKELLYLSELHMYDIYANPFKKDNEKISYEDAKKEVLSSLSVLGDEYTNKLKEAFDNNWVDVYEKDNKMSSAYSYTVYKAHPFVLTNFVNTSDDVNTLAHELGHAMHGYYACSNQSIFDAVPTIMTTEVASTVNEILLADYRIKNEQDKTKKAELLYSLIENIRITYFRQTMFAEFEEIVHRKIEDGESLSAEDFNSIYYKLNEKYFGKDVIIDDQIKYEWSRIPHFYSDFYVYKYATGISAAISIATRIIDEEPGFTDKYIDMLKQGRSKNSIELLKMVDVDLESKDTYENTIKFYEQKIQELKELI